MRLRGWRSAAVVACGVLFASTGGAEPGGKGGEPIPAAPATVPPSSTSAPVSSPAAPQVPPESTGAGPASPGAQAEAPVPDLCLPSRSARGVLAPLACAGFAVLAVSAVTALGFELHARSYHDGLVARGFEPTACAAGGPEAGSAECKEVASRFRQRDDAVGVMSGAAIAAGLLAVGAVVAAVVDPPRSTTKVAVTVIAGGGGLAVQGTW